MTDPQADARALIRAKGLTGEDLTALARLFWDEAEYGESPYAAARRLAAPEPAAPVWPERVWAVFGHDGVIVYVELDHYSAERARAEGAAPIPARLVPLDGSRVVLAREELAGLCDQARQLCYAIEAIPAGEEQTAASVRGSDLSRALRRLYDDAALAAGGGA